MQKPDFKFQSHFPVDDPRSIDGDRFKWAVVERLDYISWALYEMMEKIATPTRDDSGEESEPDCAEQV